MRLAFLGTPDFAVPTLAAILAAGHDVACVYSQPPAERGRGRQLKPTPVQAFAESSRLLVRTPVSLKTPEEWRTFAELKLDAAVVVAFGQILTREILEAPRLGCFNLHGSLLPKWRGAAPIQRAIMAGDPVTGVEVMRMDEGLDTGPTLARATTRIDALDTAGALSERLAKVGAQLMVEALARLERGEAELTPQTDGGATYARKIRAAEARIRWDRSAERIDRQIRGLSPHPGAWFEAAGAKGAVRIKALLSRLEEGDGEPGEVLDDGLRIACGEGAVRILKVQREGRAAQEAADFLRGFPIARGVRLT